MSQTFFGFALQPDSQRNVLSYYLCYDHSTGMKKKTFIYACVISVFLGCAKDEQPEIWIRKPIGCDSTEFHYKQDIKPIITANCSGLTCHSGGNANYDYRFYAVLADRIRSGFLEDRLLLPITDFKHMPDGRPLSPCDLFTLRTWIYQGYKDN
jgi:hypothetical protein